MIGRLTANRHGAEGWVHEELVRQAKQGDAEAFDALARTVGDRCLAIAVKILRDRTLATPDEIRAMTVVATIVGGVPAYCGDPEICSPR